jgi:hypothetical protein
MEVSSSSVVAQTFPTLEDLSKGGLGQLPDVWETPDPTVVISDDGLDLCLLEHDFRDPNLVRIPRFSPGERAFIFMKPKEEKGLDFLDLGQLHDLILAIGNWYCNMEYNSKGGI